MKFQDANLLVDGKSSFTHPPSYTEAVVQRCSVKKVFLEISQNSQKSTCARVSFLIKLLATLAQVFSCEFWEISKITFFNRTPPVAASGESDFKGSICNYIMSIPGTRIALKSSSRQPVIIYLVEILYIWLHLLKTSIFR